MEIEEFQRLYDSGYDCGQSVVFALRDRVAGDVPQAMRSVSCTGMGMMEGAICGGLVAAFVLIGMRYGNDGPDFAAKGLALIKKEEFMREFRKRYSGTTCPELMGGLDVRREEDNLEAARRGVYADLCPKLCRDIAEILEGVIRGRTGASGTSGRRGCPGRRRASRG